MAVAAGFEEPIFGARTVGQVTTLVLEGEDGPLALLSLRGVGSDHAGGWYATTGASLHVSAAGRVRTVATCEGGGKCGIVTSPGGSALFVTDYGNHKIRRVEVASGVVTTIAGSGEEGDADGVGDAGQFNSPAGLAVSPDGSARFVADLFNHEIRRVEVATGAVTTLAGSGEAGSADGVGDEARFAMPRDLAISADGSTLSVCETGRLRQVCVAAPPRPPSFAPIVVPPSTFSADMKKTRGDASLPHGPVTFLVGDDEERVEHVSKCALCVRSVFFRTMFGIGMKERDAAEVTVLETDLASFTALVRYLLTDQLDLGKGEGEQARRALVLRQLAHKYQVPRLELLCAQALQESVGPASAVPLLEAAHTTGDGRLLAQCRRYVADHAGEVRASGGVEQLRDLGVAKGLLGDALDQVAELKGTVAARDTELEKVRAEVAERA